MRAEHRFGTLITILLTGIGLGLIGARIYTSNEAKLPSWLSISARDISSINVDGWGPGASGTYVIHPASGQSSSLIRSLVNHLPKDRKIRTHFTPVSGGGENWLEIQLKSGSTIKFMDFPDEPTPIQYHVILTNKSGKQDSAIMVSDISGGVSSVINAIKSKGIMVRHKTH